jgi:AI-2 transport protein TqsA
MLQPQKVHAELRPIYVLAAIVIFVAGLKSASTIITPLLLAIFIAVISGQPVIWLQKKGLPKVIAIPSVVIGLIVVLSGVGGLVGSSLANFSENLPQYEESVVDFMTGSFALFEQLGMPVTMEQIQHSFDPGAVMKFTAGALNGLAGFMSNAFIILLVVVFMLFEMDDIPAKLKAISTNRNQPNNRPYEISRKIRNYLAIKTLTSFSTGLLITIWLWILGVEYAILWGLIAFLMNYIPNIGSLIAAVPAVLFAAVEMGSGAALWTGVGYLIINFVIGSVVEPKVMGEGMGLSTLVVFLSLIFWGWVLGSVGMFLSVPLTMVLKIIFESRDDTRNLAILLGTKKDASKYLDENP